METNQITQENIDALILNYIDNEQYQTAITLLQRKDLPTYDWNSLKQQYYSKHHDILNIAIRPNSKKKDFTRTRIHLPLQKLACDRMAELMFGSEVKRRYSYPTDSNEDTYKQIANAIEKIYKSLKIDDENIQRATTLFACQEFATIIYLKKESNNKYGFNSAYKLRLKTYSPINGDRLYPFFDDYNDLIAFSVEYSKKVYQDDLIKDVVCLDTYTKDYIYHFTKFNGSAYEPPTIEKNVLGKIPCVYCYRKEPLYAPVSKLTLTDSKSLIDEIEEALSNVMDVNKANSSPILVGRNLMNIEQDNGSAPQRFYEVSENGDIKYLTWDQSTDSVRYGVDQLMKLFFQLLQLPDLSFENLRSLGLQSGVAMQMYLTDSNLKIIKEQGVFISLFERECSIIKTILKKINVLWEPFVDNVEVEHIIQSYTPKDISNDIKNLTDANGGKPIISQKESIMEFGLSKDADQTLKQIQEEESQPIRQQLFD